MATKTPVYMDYHSTTPVDPIVLEEMLPFFYHEFGNAASIDHIYGAYAIEAVENSRKRISNLINSKPEEIIFTSGATESDNLAVQGVIDYYSTKGNHIITCETEHKAILDTCKHLEKKGIDVTYLPVDKHGLIDLVTLENEITDKTILITIMMANNEIGTIAPIAEIGNIAHNHGIIFHTDAAQSVGHIPIDVESMNIDLMSISGHKIYGPKGIGALYVRKRNPKVTLSPIIFGGGHERGLRSGTLNVPGIVGLGKALELSKNLMIKENKNHKKWTSFMFDAIKANYNNVTLNGHPTQRLSHNLNLCLGDIENKALINLLNKKIAFSTGSACTSMSVQHSHVLKAIGLTGHQIDSSIRLGLGRFTTEDEVVFAIKCINDGVNKLKIFNA